MRQALVSLIAAAVVAAPAMAQESTPAVPPVPVETPATPPQPSVPEANPSTAAVPAVQTPPAAAPAEVAPVAVPMAADVAPVAVPVPAAPPVVEAPPPPPPPPTEPTTVRALALIENLCKPLIAGGDPAAVTKSLGFKKKRESFVLTLAKPTVFTITPSPSNKNVCRLEIDHPIGVDKDMTVGLHNWAIARGFKLERNDEFTTDMKRHTRSWEKSVDGKYEALVMVTTRKPDGSPFSRNADRTTVMYSVQ